MDDSMSLAHPQEQTDHPSSGSIISSTSDFKAFWKTVAGEFASNDKVIFDTSTHIHLLHLQQHLTTTT